MLLYHYQGAFVSNIIVNSISIRVLLVEFFLYHLSSICTCWYIWLLSKLECGSAVRFSSNDPRPSQTCHKSFAHWKKQKRAFEESGSNDLFHLQGLKFIKYSGTKTNSDNMLSNSTMKGFLNLQIHP